MGANVRRRTPWISFLLIIVVFLIISNDWGISERIQDRKNVTDYRMKLVAHGSQIKRVVVPLLGLYGGVSLLRTLRHRRVRVEPYSWFVILLCLWALLSVGWTESLGLTVRRLVVFVCFALGAFAVAMRSSSRDVGVLICLSCGLYLLYSIYCELSLGTLDIGKPNYRFGGTLVANVQGINCSLVVLSGAFLAGTARKSKWFWYALTATGLVFLVLTKSRAGFGAALLAIIVYRSMISKGSQRVRIVYLLIFGVAFLFLLFGDDFLSTASSGMSLGRDLGDSASLNGRIPLWKECLQYAAMRPLFGYGFHGFWTPQRLGMISSSQGWNIGSGHSMYVDVFLDLGLIGLAVFLVVVFGGMLRSYGLHGKSGVRGFAFFVGFLVFFATEGIMESQFLTPGHLAFMSMVVVSNLAFASDVSVAGGRGESD